MWWQFLVAVCFWDSLRYRAAPCLSTEFLKSWFCNQLGFCAIHRKAREILPAPERVRAPGLREILPAPERERPAARFPPSAFLVADGP